MHGSHTDKPEPVYFPAGQRPQSPALVLPAELMGRAAGHAPRQFPPGPVPEALQEPGTHGTSSSANLGAWSKRKNGWVSSGPGFSKQVLPSTYALHSMLIGTNSALSTQYHEVSVDMKGWSVIQY